MSAARRAPGPRRVLLLVFHIGAGGMEQQLLHLARGLALRGDAVTVGCYNPLSDVSAAAQAGVRFVRLGSTRRAWRMTGGVARVARLARAHDLVHCTGWDASLWGRLGGVLARRPVLVTDHSPGRAADVSNSTGRSRARLIALHHRALGPVTYATIAVADAQVPMLLGEGVRPEALVTVPNGIPLEPIRAAARAPGRVTRGDLGVPDDARVVIHVGRFEAQKRQHLTLDAVARVRRDLGADVRVLFVGQGAQRPALQARAAAEGAGWAHFLGVRDDVPALLALADLAVLPSRAEALPMAMIEALAVGVPQVASAVGDVGEVLAATGGGIAVPADDAEAFVAACRDVLGEPALATRLGRAGAEAAERFSAATMVRRYSALFDAALDGRPAAEAVLA